jgi:hypothetical protein
MHLRVGSAAKDSKQKGEHCKSVKKLRFLVISVLFGCDGRIGLLERAERINL